MRHNSESELWLTYPAIDCHEQSEYQNGSLAIEVWATFEILLIESLKIFLNKVYFPWRKVSAWLRNSQQYLLIFANSWRKGGQFGNNSYGLSNNQGPSSSNYLLMAYVSSENPSYASYGKC